MLLNLLFLGVSFGMNTPSTNPSISNSITVLKPVDTASTLTDSTKVKNDTLKNDTLPKSSSVDTIAKKKKHFQFGNIFSNTVGEGSNPNYKAPKIAWAFGPGVYYTPSTSVAFIIGGQLFFDEMDKKSQSPKFPSIRSKHAEIDSLPLDSLQKKKNAAISKRSNLLMGITATIQKQFSIDLNPEIYLINHRLSLQGFFRFGYWPYTFWGIGRNTAESAQESYDQIFGAVRVKAAYEVVKGLSFGAGLQYYWYNITKQQKNGLLATGAVYGAKQSQGLGIILSGRFDSRDNNLSPRKGNYTSIEALYNTNTFGAAAPYWRIDADLRHYFHISQKSKGIEHVFALNLVLTAEFGDKIPFQEMAQIAGSKNSRGILVGRYTDYNMSAFQIEYRFYYKWFGLVAFGCFSDVGRKFIDVLQFEMCTYGVGIRLKPFKKLPFTVRGDVGIWKNKPQFYVGINEIF